MNLLWLQALRFFAATAVVVFHATRYLVLYPANSVLAHSPFLESKFFTQLAQAGVDIFFVISGFIIFYISGPYRDGLLPVSHFLKRRFLRIYPLYFVVIAAIVSVSVYYVYVRHLDPPYDIAPWRVISAFFLVPSFDGFGGTAPILIAAWTLTYEAFFYLCFAGCLYVAPKHLIAGLLVLFSIIIIVFRSIEPENAFSAVFRSTIVFEFLFGATVATLYRKQRIPDFPITFIGFGIACLLLHQELPNPDYRFLVWGIPACLIVAGFISLEASGRRPYRFWTDLGSASYAIYLVHIVVIDVAIRLIGKVPLPIQNESVVALIVLAVILASLAIGTIMFVSIDRPVQIYLATTIRQKDTSSPT